VTAPVGMQQLFHDERVPRAHTQPGYLELFKALTYLLLA
jgi:hypothetical protein